MSREREGEVIKANSEIVSHSPSILRDKQGRVQWRQPGNTEDDNLQLGIQNVQGLFLEQFPEFVELFTLEDGIVAEEKREEARDFIWEHLGSKDRFTKVIGESARLKRNTPYFEGSYRTALQLSFASWGVTFDFKTLELQRETVSSGDAMVTIQAFATKYGLAHSTVKDLLGDSRIDHLGMARAFYPEAELLSRCRSFLDLPKANKDTGTYIDESGDEWAPAKYFARENDLHDRLVAASLQGLPTREGRGKSGHRVVFYRKVDVLKQLESVFSSRTLPQIDPDTNKYTDEGQEEWMTAYDACISMGVDKSTFLRYVDRIRSLEGRDKTGRTRRLYSVADIDVVIGRFTSLPHVDSETGKYIDPEGTSWVVGGFFYKEGYSESVINRLGRDIPSIEGRDVLGRKTKLYSEVELRNALERFSSLPQVERDTGRYTDDDNTAWVTTTTLSKELGLSQSTVLSYLGEVPSIAGRDRAGKEVTLYSETAVKTALEGVTSLPKVDTAVGNYVDENGDSWVPISYLKQKYGASGKSIQNKLRETATIIGRDKVGRGTTLYSEREAELVLNYLHTIPRVDSESEEYVDEQGNAWGTISHFSMQMGIDREALVKRLEGVDKISGLASNGKKVELFNKAQVVETTRGLFALPRVTKDIGKVIDDDGEAWISLGAFCKDMGISQTGMQRYLSGCSFIQGRERNGVETKLFNREQLIVALETKKSLGKREWATLSVEQRNKLIEDEIEKFISGGGRLSQSGLNRGGLKWLISVIYKYYPGGLLALKDKFGLQLSSEESAQISPAQANEELLQFLDEDDIPNPRGD